jgi:hypothetical protein
VIHRRSEALQSVVQTAAAAFKEFSRGPQSERTVERVFSALTDIPTTGSPGSSGSPDCPGAAGTRLPVCSHLGKALSVATPHEGLRQLIAGFNAIESLLQWRRRPVYDAATASANFVEGHANAMIVGPGGLEERRDVWVGVSLLAPHVRYPDHNHDPEEVYLVLSEGEFRQEEGDWFSPGIGGSFYNRPRIRHAMRSLEQPLFAFWILRPEVSGQ